MGTPLNSYKKNSLGICSGGKLSNFECVDDIVLLGEDPIKLHVFLHFRDPRVIVFGSWFWLLMCKMLVHHWTHMKPNIVLAGEELGEVDSSNYLGCFVSTDHLLLDEVTSRMQKDWLAFSSSLHLGRRCDIRLALKKWGLRDHTKPSDVMRLRHTVAEVNLTKHFGTGSMW